MYVVGLDGKQYSFNPKNKVRNNASKLHKKCKALLKEIMPTHKVLEEVKIPGAKLYLDFYIPFEKMAIEVHGEQHHKFNNHFYKSQAEFLKAKVRDYNKREWCQLNMIELIELNYNEDLNEWRSKISSK